MARITETETPGGLQWGWGRFAFSLIGGVVLMLSALLIWRQVEDFLIKDDRFRIAEGDELAATSPNLIVEGVRYASPAQVRHVFAEDFGRSVALVPVEKRRNQLLDIDWVETAAVSKIWPNTVRVKVSERTPVAFVSLPPNRKDGMSQFALIDKDGYILRPRVPSKFTLPVIRGVKETERLENRRARVHRVLAMLNAIGAMAAQVSEVDVTDPNNLVVAEHIDASVVNLMLGDENYAERLRNFLNNYGEIKAKRPDSTTLDLRVDGVITAVGSDKHGA